MLLKKLGAQLKQWEDLSRKSTKYRTNDCAKRWSTFKTSNMTGGPLIYLAKEGDLDKYNSVRPSLRMSTDIYNDGVEHPCSEIDTPFIITKDPKAPDKNEGQKEFQRTVDDFLADVSKKSLVVRSRYGSGKTTVMQRLIQEQNLAKVLFITCRQTLARDMTRIFKNFGV